MTVKFLVVLCCATLIWAQYEPNWESLDTRPIPSWFDEAKVGIFLHWGVYSVPSTSSAWFWQSWRDNTSDYVADFMRNNYKPSFTYQDFAVDFTAEFFNPDQWADLFKRAGANYVVLTSKHHEGFTLWPSKYSFSWNSMDVGPRRDLVGDLGTAVRNAGLRYGLYHSLFEWYNPMFLSDQDNNFTTQEFVDKKMLPELYELVTNYQPEVIWSDGDWMTSSEYFKSLEFLPWLYNESPVRDTVVTNDRWGADTWCIHGDYFNCADRYNPGSLQPHKWENAFTIDRGTWEYRRDANIEDFLSPNEIISQIVSTVSCNGNALVDVGPTKEGTISPIFQERLLQMGAWLAINGEAIYASTPWTTQQDTLNGNVWYTAKGDNVYATALAWPGLDLLRIRDVLEFFQNNNPEVVILQNPDSNLEWDIVDDEVQIRLPDYRSVENDAKAWSFRFTPTV